MKPNYFNSYNLFVFYIVVIKLCATNCEMANRQKALSRILIVMIRPWDYILKTSKEYYIRKTRMLTAQQYLQKRLYILKFISFKSRRSYVCKCPHCTGCTPEIDTSGFHRIFHLILIRKDIFMFKLHMGVCVATPTYWATPTPQGHAPTP